MARKADSHPAPSTRGLAVARTARLAARRRGLDDHALACAWRWGLRSLLAASLVGLLPGHPVSAATPAAASATTPMAMDILDYQIDGNTRLSQEQLENAVYPYMGPGRTLHDVEAARTALEQAYHDAGYLTVFVDIPPQHVQDGRVRLVVTEGRIAHLRVLGAQHHEPAQITQVLTQLDEGSVPNFGLMQTQLAQINRSDLSVTPVLKAGREPGTVDADVQVRDASPWHGHVELNNRYSEGTHHERLEAALRDDDVLGQGHSLGVDFTTAPADVNQISVWRANYAQLSSAGGWSISALHSSSTVNAVADVDVLGAGTVLGWRLSGPWFPLGTLMQNWSAGLDYKNFQQQVHLGVSGYATPLHYLPVQLTWQTQGGQDAGQHNLALTFNANFRGLGSTDAPFENARYGARASYLYLRADGFEHWPLIGGSELQLRFSGQVTAQPLVSNESFAIGGADSVRGYTEAERVGDDGVNASVQWLSPALGRAAVADASLPWQWRVLVFDDWATARILDALPHQTGRFYLSSLGLGVHLSAPGGVSSNLALARPTLPDIQGNKHPRLHGDIRMDF